MPTSLLPVLLSQATLAAASPNDLGSSDDAGADWTRFRGPAATSVLGERGYPATWSADENVAWSVAIEGSGWSSPIVVDGRVFVSAAVDPEDDGPAGMAAGVRDPSTRGSGAKPEDELTFRLTCRDLAEGRLIWTCLLYTSPSPRDQRGSRMPSSA